MKDKTELKIVMGGVDLEVTFLDETTETVKVRILSVRQLVDKWITMQGNEPGLVELYCAKDDGWDDKLTPESHAAILKVGGELNDPTFARWAADRRAAIDRLNEVTAGLIPAMGSNSPTSSSPAPSSSTAPQPK